jgi:hypothetical protein
MINNKPVRSASCRTDKYQLPQFPIPDSYLTVESGNDNTMIKIFLVNKNKMLESNIIMIYIYGIAIKCT